jgi:type II secretory pathway predicted ATPase ExeA
MTLEMHIPSRHPSSRPFMAAPRTQFYHPATLIEAALKGIERCIRRAEGASLVVGTPGTGKSLLLAKVADHVRDDFDVALLSGASICTRRALWQAVMAAIGEPYRGIDEADLRIALVERIRGLAATGSGLAILVDEANTLPTRLIEELRLYISFWPAPSDSRRCSRHRGWKACRSGSPFAPTSNRSTTPRRWPTSKRRRKPRGCRGSGCSPLAVTTPSSR